MHAHTRTPARVHERAITSPPLVTQLPHRAAWQDLGCFDFVPHDSSGVCECAGGHMTAATDCEHEGFTCQKECRLLRQRRRQQKAAGQRAAGLTPTKALDAGYEKLFAVGAFGAKGSVLDGFGLICSDGSRTAIAGAPRPGPTAQPGALSTAPPWRYTHAGSANKTADIALPNYHPT